MAQGVPRTTLMIKQRGAKTSGDAMLREVPRTGDYFKRNIYNTNLQKQNI